MLEGVARKGGTITYGQLMGALGLRTEIPANRALIGTVLDDISRACAREHKPLLPALVHRKTAGIPRPSETFFRFVREELKVTVDDEDQFLQRQLDAVWRAYCVFQRW